MSRATAEASVASLKALIDGRRSIATHCKRLARQLDDLDLAVKSVTSQSGAQQEKINTCEEAFAKLVQCGYLKLPPPKAKTAPARKAAAPVERTGPS